jgi:DNA-binding XRE family transcriptional regulator
MNAHARHHPAARDRQLPTTQKKRACLLMSVPGLARVRVRESATSPGAAGRSRTNGPGLLAVAVRELRTERGLSVSALARRAAIDRRTIQQLVRGQLRPRPSLLWAIAYGADPDQSAEVRERLLAAAVPSIVPDKSHARVRSGRRALQSLAVP